MSEGSTKKARWPGRVVGLVLFVCFGLPLTGLFILGERACDLGDGPPCTISWETRNILVLLSALSLSAAAGWLTNKAINSERTGA
jgi:hypothetical protein